MRVIFKYEYAGNMDQEENEYVLSIMNAIMKKESIAKVYTEVPREGIGSRIWWSLDTPRESPLNQPVTVITIVEDDTNGIFVSSSWSDEYDQDGVLPKELADYDRVLFFRVMVEGNSDQE